jgi:cbb3-type cytochrome oxidase subunit 3
LGFLILALSCVYSVSCKEELDETVAGNLTLKNEAQTALSIATVRTAL